MSSSKFCEKLPRISSIGPFLSSQCGNIFCKNLVGFTFTLAAHPVPLVAILCHLFCTFDTLLQLGWCPCFAATVELTRYQKLNCENNWWSKFSKFDKKFEERSSSEPESHDWPERAPLQMVVKQFNGYFIFAFQNLMFD